jgi:hypothetical protein
VAFVLRAGAKHTQADDGRIIDIVVNPSTLTADGASTAAITVTVLTSGTLQTPMQGVTLTGYLSLGTLGEVITPFGFTDSNGQASST